mgnify:CR=1 FL=1
MSGETSLVLVGNLTADPELRYTQSGVAVATFTIVSTPKKYTVWREFAEHVAQSLKKGTRVIAQGRLEQHNYETREGDKRTSYQATLDAVGPDLRFATAVVERAQAGGSRAPQQAGGSPWGGNQQQPAPTPQQHAQPQSSSAWDQPPIDDTPF